MHQGIEHQARLPESPSGVATMQLADHTVVRVKRSRVVLEAGDGFEPIQEP
jgi:hypothetical protein